VATVSQFGLKTGGSGLVVWASKPLRRFFQFGLKTGGFGFLVWASKPSGGGLSVWTSKPTGGWSRAGEHVSTSRSFLGGQEGVARFSPVWPQNRCGGGRVVHVAPSQELALRLREVIDGQMDFGAAQDDKDQVTPRLRSFSFEPTGAF